ncbi:MAG: bifunctional phosphoribosylaminoimidazolecarboxamide formyltransferase/IMP cyclohydrolase [Chitinophagaceae bacterium]
MNKKIKSVLVSVFYKDGLELLIQQLSATGITIYSTGGTQTFIENLGIKVIPVETLTTYPSILGGRVKTLHPMVFGGILGKRDDETHLQEMKQFGIPEIDLVIVDLYPFEETVATTTDEKAIIEKIDIGGPSMLRAAAKNHKEVTVIARKDDYTLLSNILKEQNGETTIEQRRMFAIKAFDVCTAYDTAISNYFHHLAVLTPYNKEEKTMRYGENPHQKAIFFGNLNELFDQLNGKDLSYNNIVDVDAAMQLIKDIAFLSEGQPAGHKGVEEVVFAIIKHTNVCGISQRQTVKDSWDAALAGDPQSAFGGVLVCNGTIDKATAEAINEIFFEVLIAPAFNDDALELLKSKKNRILIKSKEQTLSKDQYKSVLNGVLIQSTDEVNFSKWDETGGRETTDNEKTDLMFANIICKHLKSNAIALVKNKQLIGKGCGQTSRIDSLHQAIEKAKHFNFNMQGAVMASDAFFPFDDCVKLGNKVGISAYIQPGGSIRDIESIEYCKEHNLAMVMTEMRHFKH